MTTTPSAHAQAVALVTGATAGIGYELARVFAEHGHPLILVGRNAERLERVAKELQSAYDISATVLSKDLARPEAPVEIFRDLQQTATAVGILVNNAGFGTYGPFAIADADSQLQMIQVNIAALTQLTRLFLPEMIERGFGKILNVASTAAFQPGPLMAVYYASKAYVLFFSEALANEVRQSGVTVSALCPGPTATEFQERAKMQKSRLVSGAMMDARTVALAGYHGLMKNKPVIIPGVANRLLAFSTRLTPRKWVTGIVRRMMEERKS
jgi:short-subunit dehydrogenase